MVTYSDELMIAKSIVNSIRKDGISETYQEASEEDQKKIMFAYLDNAIKKIEKFQTKIMTNQEAKKVFIETVFWLL